MNFTVKYGRNAQSQLNPHNTNNATINIQKKLKNSAARGKMNNEIKKLNLENLKNKVDSYKYVTSSVDNREVGKKPIRIKNLNVDCCERLINNKTNSLSPTRMMIDSNSNIVYLDKENQKSFNSIQGVKIKSNNSNNLTPDKVSENNQTGLNDLMNSLNLNSMKSQDNKSRNAARNNLTATKSNIFQSDKAQSMQSGSFHKNNIFSQAAIKTSMNSQIINKNLAKSKAISSINKTASGAGISIYKPFVLNPNKSIDKSKINSSKNNLVKKNTSVTINNKNYNQSIGSLMKKTVVNLASLNTNKNSVSINNTINNLRNNADGNTANITGNNTANHSPNVINFTGNASQVTQNSQNTQMSQMGSQITQSGKSTQSNCISQNKKNSLTIYNKSKNVIFIFLANSEISPARKNNCYNVKIDKIDSSKQKTKSNSVTSNASNIISTNNTNSKNPTKLTNISFLNLKRNEFTVARNYTNTTSEKSSKAMINTLSSGSLEKQLLRKPSKENSHLY
jgi:hypothetical protein